MTRRPRNNVVGDRRGTPDQGPTQHCVLNRYVCVVWLALRARSGMTQTAITRQAAGRLWPVLHPGA